MIPTDAGTMFYNRASILLQELEDAVNDVRPSDRSLRGIFRIAAPLSISLAFLREALVGFARKHSDLRLEIELDDKMVDLTGGVYDVAIRMGRLKDSGLRAKQLARGRRVVCASKSYLESFGFPSNLNELSDHHTIGYSNQSNNREWEFEEPQTDDAISVKVVSQFAYNAETMRDAAIAGLGLCILPEVLVKDQLRTGDLVRVMDHIELTDVGLYVVYLPGREQSAKVRALIEHLTQYFQDVDPLDIEN
jgi:DNA-binding transcriptional LysR family regulator